MIIHKFCRLDDGRSVSYRVGGDGPVLVLLHGWGMSSLVFAPLMQRLSRCRRIIAPDLRGHGHSHGGPGYALGDFAADIEQCLNLAGVEEIALLGWSLGGMVALEMVERLGERLKKLILISTTPCFVQRDGWPHGQPASRVNALSRRFRRDPAAALEGFFLQQFDGETKQGSLVQTCKHELFDLAPLPLASAGLGGLSTLCDADLRELSPRCLPTLIMHGRCDAIIPPAAGEYLARRLPEAQWKLLDGVGHAPFIGRPDFCADILADFLI
jgi:pimeloyl-[acyl-carrier protein] methyl ester esterase